MTRDYAKKSRPRSNSAGRAPSKPRSNSRKPAPPSGPSTWQWLIVVAVTSAFVGFVVYLNAVPPEAPPGAEVKPAPAAIAKPATPVAKPEPSPGKPEYRFYELLPNSEVDPPEVEAYNSGKGQRQQYEYIVQTGSFRNMADAQRQKAQIGFQGLRADISRVDLDSGATWYRVQVGPYQSRSTMNGVVDRLVSINIQPLVRKEPLETATP